MLAAACLLGIPLLIWIAQSVALRASGRPIRLAMGGSDLPPAAEAAVRVATHVGLAGAVVAYPLLLGHDPLRYYARFFPLEAATHDLVFGFAAGGLYLALLYLAWTLTGQVRFEHRRSLARVLRRLITLPFAAVLIALVEELLFRAVLLEDLLRTLPASAAIAIGATAFAAAHYVRRVKRYWTFFGHVALGVLLCIAYVESGALWLPIALHAGGIVLLLGVRPFIRYEGPGWLIGASIFPYAGVAGIAALLLLSAEIAARYGERMP